MEDIICQIDCGSNSDSIVTRILISAIDKAQEKLQFKDGPIEFLHELTTFYELTAILVEGGLNIAQEESDEILESSCGSKILSDLMGIRQWVVERIRAMKQLIIEKDREFREILALIKNEGDVDVSALKNSVDELQVFNIKHYSSPNLSFDFHDLFVSEDDDFGAILKLTIDLTSEKQWRRAIERDVESVLVKGFERDVQARFDIELKKRIEIVKDSWFDFTDETRNLFHELKGFFSRNEVHVLDYKGSSNVQPRRRNSEPNIHVNFTEIDVLENIDGDEVGGSSHVWKIIRIHESIIRRQREQRGLLTRDGLQREASSTWLKRNEDINAMERRIQDAITRLENFTWMNREVSGLKGGVGGNRAREKSHGRTVDGASTTIRSFDAEIKKLQEERDGLCFQISVTEDTYQLLFRGVMKDFSAALCSGETAADESKGSNSYQMLLHYMESRLREDVYVVVLQETVEQWKTSQSDSVRGSKTPQEDSRCSPILRDYTESLVREDIYLVVFQEMVKQWKMNEYDSVRGSKIPSENFCCSPVKRDCMESLVREDIYVVVFKETIKQWKMSQFDSIRNSKTPQEGFRCSPILQDCTKSLLREDLSENVLAIIKRFQFLVDNVDIVLHENLESKCLRVEALKHQVDELNQHVAGIRRRKLLYEKAFISRCRNLKLAEIEVDLLGDKVETLVYLLERIYLVLNQNATVLSRYFEVYEILKLIKIELNGGDSSKPKS